MAALWKAAASSLLVALALTLLGWRAEAQGNGRDKVHLHVTVTQMLVCLITLTPLYTGLC